MKNNTFTRFLANHIDYSVPDFFEFWGACYWAALTGEMLAVVLYLGVYYL